ncbi:hypothetical protein Tsubulata_014058 [Turnera subulata]|uniref:Enoyl reductase (ER) domain-containing protein n=1 Tax=Turnera subulata TaxID=218843 RepID=A0A9Q0GGV8_9ROSI|nr:hypothetical protein Tsubulata_014058 [Turnera subulata]
MLALLCKKLGDPSTKASGEESPIELTKTHPIPQLNSPTAVRVRVKATSLNYANYLQVLGKYQEKYPLPFILGSDYSGTVEAVGPNVTRFKVGDKVCSLASLGSFAQFIVTQEADLYKVPEGCDLVAAAALPVAFGTSHVALMYRANLRSGQVLLVLGAAGGVGLSAVQIGKAVGATVIGVVRGAEKVQFLKSYGVDHVVDLSKESIIPSVKDFLKTKKLKGVDVFYDPVGGKLTKESLKLLNWGAQILVIGFASGEIPVIPVNLALVKNWTIHGLYWGSYKIHRPGVTEESMEELFSWLKRGLISIHISHTYSLSEANLAFAAIKDRKAIGKVVLTIGDGSSAISRLKQQKNTHTKMEAARNWYWGSSRTSLLSLSFLGLITPAPLRLWAPASHGSRLETKSAPLLKLDPLLNWCDLVAAAALPVAFGTSHAALLYRANLRSGQVLLVLGAAGGVGLSAVQIGKAVGATVIAVVRGAEKVQFLKSYGVDHVVDSSKESIIPSVKDFLKTRKLKGVDVLYDPVGGKLTKESLKLLNWGAQILVIGFASGEIPVIPVNLALVKNWTIHGFLRGSYKILRPGVTEESMKELFSWLERGLISIHISHTYSLSENFRHRKKEMEALVCKKLGDASLPLSSEDSPLVLTRTHPIPQLGSSPTAVRVRVKATSLNFLNYLQIAGQYQEKPPLPFVPGSDYSGTIDAVGPGVTRFKVGDRVCSSNIVGTFAEFFVTEEAKAQLTSGQVLLVLGAAGGVGLSAIQVGKVCGAIVIAVVRGPEKVQFLKSFGVDHVVDSSEGSIIRSVKDFLKARKLEGVDVLYDPVGGKLTLESLKLLKLSAQILLIGFASGEVPVIPANIALVKNWTVHGFYWGRYPLLEGSLSYDSVKELLSWVARGLITIHISHTYRLSEASLAFSTMKDRQVLGKVMLTIGDERSAISKL